jgi:SAM-dependent methyltransferase
MSCCRARGAEPFTERQARRDARRLRRKGLDGWAQRLAGSVDPAGTTVLEVGAGVGGLTFELLRRGAVHAVDVELSPGYEQVAAELARERGLERSVDRRVLDFAHAADELEPAGVVVMHRVVCCTPAGPAIVRAAAERTERALAFSFPRARWWMRAGAGVLNAAAALARWEWRFYVHPPAALTAAAEAAGLRETRRERGLVWELAAFERP